MLCLFCIVHPDLTKDSDAWRSLLPSTEPSCLVPRQALRPAADVLRLLQGIYVDSPLYQQQQQQQAASSSSGNSCVAVIITLPMILMNDNTAYICCRFMTTLRVDYGGLNPNQALKGLSLCVVEYVYVPYEYDRMPGIYKDPCFALS